jgi:hypothetical protein
MLSTSSNLLYQQVILADDIIEIIYEVRFEPATRVTNSGQAGQVLSGNQCRNSAYI